MPTLHLISGLPGSGKSTYSEKLAKDVNGVILRLDTFLTTLFGSYAIDAVGVDEHRSRVKRCREMIWEVALLFLERAIDVILDDGFFQSGPRVDFAKRARAQGATSCLHYLSTEHDVIRERLRERNEKCLDNTFEISDSFLDSCIAVYQVPQDEEGIELIVVAQER